MQQRQPRQQRQPKQQQAPSAGSTATSSKRPRRAEAPALSPPPRLPAATLLAWERDGFHVARRLLPPELLTGPVLNCVREVVASERLAALRQRVRVLAPGVGLESIGSEAAALAAIRSSGQELGFLQHFNLHRRWEAVAALARNKALTSLASQLLGARRLRLYQSCVFEKPPGAAQTNWHSDLRMAPLDTNAFLTAWVPLRRVAGAEGDSGLVFAKGSHRDFALPFWHDLEGLDLSERGYELADTGAMEVGDVSFHHGWLLHAAAPQPPGSAPRLALALSFFADPSATLARRSDTSVRTQLLHDEDAESYAAWLPELKDGALARHKLLPVVYP